MSKLMKKVLSIVAAIAMVLTMSAVPAFAAGSGTITITPPSNTPSNATNTYKIYKVFDADGNGTNISYKLVDGKTSAPTGFTVDAAGNVSGPETLNDTIIAAIANYVAEDEPVDTVTSTGIANAVSKSLPNGYYYITTSTGTAVTITSTNPNAQVNDKGVVPSVDKKITASTSGSVAAKDGVNGQVALAQVGAKVSYESDITVPSNTVKNLKFSDTMDSTLTLDTSSVKVQIGDTDVADSNYTIETTAQTINITFKDTYVASLKANTVIKVTYDATVNSSALTADPAKNTAKITYGDNNATVSSTTPEVYNAKFTLTKTIAGLTGEQELANDDSAEFVLKNSSDQYYAVSDTGVVSWGSLDNATKLSFNTASGTKTFTGLANDTYTLIETKVPSGYKAAGEQNITINEADSTTQENREQSATINNEQGSTLPSTGGMGTTIFYVLGAALVISAGVVLVTRKRLS